MTRRATATKSFGSGKRENHDSEGFYTRFPAPSVIRDDLINPPVVVDRLFCGDARAMTSDQVVASSVALVVTSPPYFAGKEYETEPREGLVPGSYTEYLQLVGEVLAVCCERLEPGGRMAVNTANLGRRPYRSLSADIISILQDDLGMLLRGEIIWQKAKGASGSCAWGSFRSPANPVLRDVTERVVVASKGRFDRALSRAERKRRSLPHVSTMTSAAFMEATIDVWDIPAESATRVGHPAPFPVALPQRLIELYTYEGDLVLDPFMGSGSTAIAARRSGRHYIGFDTDPAYVELAERRMETEAISYQPSAISKKPIAGS